MHRTSVAMTVATEDGTHCGGLFATTGKKTSVLRHTGLPPASLVSAPSFAQLSRLSLGIDSSTGMQPLLVTTSCELRKKLKVTTAA